MVVSLIITACLLSVPLATYSVVWWYLYSKAFEPSSFGVTEEDLDLLSESIRSQ